MSDNKKKYNKTITGLWYSRSGKVLRTMPVDPRAFDILSRFANNDLEIGGRLQINFLTEEARANHKEPDKAPHAYLEYVSKADEDAFNAYLADKNNGGSHGRD